MSRSLFPARMVARVPAIALCISIAMAGAVAAQDSSPLPAESFAGPEVESPLPAALGTDLYPLPESVATIPPDVATVSLEPGSASVELEIGVPMPFTLGHCGLLSPVDLDGSFWQPVGGADAEGGPLEDEAAVIELFNATSGELVFTGLDAAEFTTASGTRIGLVRAAGAVDYALCM